MKQNTNHIINPKIIKENESFARRAYEQGDYVLCFLLSHALIESLLRAFLSQTGKESFNELILAYENFLKSESQTELTFVNELNKFNRRRNRVVHELWRTGYSATNEKLETACRGAFTIFGLLIEWLVTFDPEITEAGFEYEKE
jgi:hypothetical protein